MNKKRRFRDFVMKCAKTEIFEDTPIGDFVDDVKDDKTFPNHNCWEDIELHLKHKRACHEAIEAAKELHIIWRKVFR